jgi:transcriptional regulator GlxA family with amidase domain
MDARIAAAIERLDEVIVDGGTLDERTIARSAGLSLSRFRHLFRAALSCTPNQYARRARLIRAAVLLQHTNVQVKVVWLDLGFKSAAHFSRVFRAQFGIRPSGFRNGGSRSARSARL